VVDDGPILVTGAAGQLGAVGRTVTGLLLDRGLPVRAMVRRENDRTAALRVAGAEVVVGDLLEPADVYRVVRGCRRVYFGMSVSAGYLEATVIMAAVALEVGVNALVNMSQMTVSQMSIQNNTPSPQQRQHWLSEQALAWSGLPVVTIRPDNQADGRGSRFATSLLSEVLAGFWGAFISFSILLQPGVLVRPVPKMFGVLLLPSQGFPTLVSLSASCPIHRWT
jgi:uncharacterized protein YbjT (DUF2867 family)